MSDRKQLTLHPEHTTFLRVLIENWQDAGPDKVEDAGAIVNAKEILQALNATAVAKQI